MVRIARTKSSTGVYHLIIRGINRQNIFECSEDFEKYLDVLKTVKEISSFKLYGYCLLDNHAHFLIEEGEENLATVFKRLGSRYVIWFNRKYARTGPLFQGRYHSEAVEDDTYLLTALRYILQNPVMAGICKDPGNYRWSSYRDYLGKDQGLTDIAFVLEQLSSDTSKQRRSFVEFVGAQGDEHMDVDQNTPDACKKKMQRICGVDNASEFQALDSDKKAEGVRMLRESGVSIRQIVRLTGVSFHVARKLGE